MLELLRKAAVIAVSVLSAIGCHSDAPSSANALDDAGSAQVEGPACGYQGLGHLLQISADEQICVPPVVCTPSETCPRGLADCVAGKCVFKTGYHGLATLPEAWATYYCDLPSGGCDGSVQNPKPYELAKAIAAKFGPVCADSPDGTGPCVGIAAVPPLLAGNSQIALDPSTGGTVSPWGQGMTAASGLCYRITGPSGASAVIGITDRCAGYCKCSPANTQNECSMCINAPDTTTDCPCVGSAPPLYGKSCDQALQCDWCASNNHAHFDLDNATFQHVCGAPGQHDGSCKLARVEVVTDCVAARADWPN